MFIEAGNASRSLKGQGGAMDFIIDWLRLGVLWAINSLAVISGFSQFSQSNTERLAVTTSSSIAREYVPASGSGDVRLTAAPPRNLSIPAFYAEIVDTMLSRSPTFRQQCERLENAPHVRVVLEHNPVNLHRGARALTTIGRAGHRVIALVRIIAEGREPELISHELEHVIEYLDDVDLASKAKLQSTGVSRCERGGAYETKRAVHVGQKVGREVRNGQ